LRISGDFGRDFDGESGVLPAARVRRTIGPTQATNQKRAERQRHFVGAGIAFWPPDGRNFIGQWRCKI